MAASSTVVIKVKHGDTLRRFNAQIAGDELNLTMVGLKNKIISLFSFEPDTELLLTYIDEDDDVVTLADDDDLRDVVKQALNPLRITVKFNAEKYGLSASSTMLEDNGVSEIFKSLPGPLYETLLKLSADLASKASSSEHVQKSLQNSNTGVSQIMRTVPEPLRENIEKLSAELASKAKFSVKVSVDQLIRSSEHVQKSLQNFNTGVSQIMRTVPESLHENIEKLSADLASKAKLSLDQLIRSSEHVQKSLQNFNTGMSQIMRTVPEPLRENIEKLSADLASKAKLSVSGLTMLKSSENSDRVRPQSAVASSSRVDKEKIFLKKLVDGKAYLTSRTTPVENNAGKGVGSSTSTSNVPFVGNYSGTEPKMLPNPASVGASDPKNALLFDAAMSGGFGKNAGPFWFPPSPASSNFPSSYTGCNTTYECPFSGLVTGTGSAASPLSASKVGPFKRSISQNDYSGNIFHRGIHCDGCGVHPITGPRFKSKLKVNYDLCSICFEEMGNDTDYIRIDHPSVYRHHMSLKGLHEARARGPTFQQVHKSFKAKPVAAKLDSRFIHDVNIFDGTVMTPVTPFTKIWRMRNNGTVVWPEETRLVWIGGDKLSNELVVEVQIPTAGLKVNQELEVAVDFKSPELPGRYISYWRMALPSGQKFGQRIWVLIQVDSSLKDAPSSVNVRNLNLNLPPGTMVGPEIINVDPQPMVEDGPSGAAKPIKREELEQQPNTDQELKFPINDSLLVGDGASSSRPVFYPIMDFTDVVAPAVHPVGPTGTYPVQEQTLYASIGPVAGGQKIADDLPGKMNVEDKLLKELEEMGFKEVDLNKQMLRMNEYDLGQAVDDLCGVAEWDPILEELQEMGFHDMAMNKMLLKKNNGSIKRVVMDLVAGEKIE